MTPTIVPHSQSEQDGTPSIQPSAPLIFVVEDDPDISALIVHTLRGAGFTTCIFQSGHAVVEAAQAQTPALILLDLMLPGPDGMEILRSLESGQRTREIRKIILSARRSELEKVRALELGADDFITKPFSPRELVLRIRAVLRSLPGDSQPTRILQVGELIADLDARTIAISKQQVHLTTTEFDILVRLMHNPGRTFSRDELLASVRSVHETIGERRMIDVYIRRLREKIEADPSEPMMLLTRRGGGYTLVKPAP